MKVIIKSFVCLILCVSICINCTDNLRVQADIKNFKYGYGVFLGLDSSITCSELIKKVSDYRIVVIDAQCFTKKTVMALKKEGHVVYSYIDIGSLEDYRSYYARFRKYALSEYDGWDGEYWVDVTKTDWQEYMYRTLAGKLVKKGIDGFFVDNCDVYYHYPTKGCYSGIINILYGLKEYGLYVCINGGDTFVKKYLKDFAAYKSTAGGKICSPDAGMIIDAINQEDVFTAVNFDTGEFSESSKDDRTYYKQYASQASKAGLDVYFLEYADGSLYKSVLAAVKKYCKKRGYKYYVSRSLNLD